MIELPQSLESEKALLACMLIAWDEVCDMLPSNPTLEDFYHGETRIIYKTALLLSIEGVDVNFHTVLQRLEEEKKLDSVGGYIGFNALSGMMVTRAQAPHFFAIVREKTKLRKLTLALQESQQIIQQPGAQASAAVAHLENSVFQLPNHEKKELSEEEFEGYVEELCDPNKPRGFSTCIDQVDYFIGGWRHRFLYAVASRAGIGKTSWLMQSQIAAWRRGASCLFFSADMAAEETWLKIGCQSAGINSWLFLKGQLPEKKGLILSHVRQLRASKRFHVIADPNPSDSEVFSVVRAHKRKFNTDIAAFDFFTCVRVEKGEKELQAYNRFAKTSKTIARTCGVAFVVLAQLNRSGSGEPGGEHIKDCDALLAAADAVILQWSDAPPEDSSAPLNHHLKLAKNRFGPRGTCEASFDGKNTCYLPQP